MPESPVAKQIADAIGAHGLWKSQLRRSIETGTTTGSIETARVDGGCAFGKWLKAAPPAVTASPFYARVRAMHARFHVAAAAVLKLVLDKKRAEAEASINGGDFAQQSAELVKELMAWRAAAA
jgi:hypothetical protein